MAAGNPYQRGELFEKPSSIITSDEIKQAREAAWKEFTAILDGYSRNVHLNAIGMADHALPDRVKVHNAAISFGIRYAEEITAQLNATTAELDIFKRAAGLPLTGPADAATVEARYIAWYSRDDDPSAGCDTEGDFWRAGFYEALTCLPVAPAITNCECPDLTMAFEATADKPSIWRCVRCHQLYEGKSREQKTIR